MQIINNSILVQMEAINTIKNYLKNADHSVDILSQLESELREREIVLDSQLYNEYQKQLKFEQAVSKQLDKDKQGDLL